MIREGDKVLVVAGKRRPGIVIAIHAGKRSALILTGTSTAGRDIPHVMFDPRRHRSLQLTNATYFYQSSLVVRHFDDIQAAPPARCPVASWSEVLRLAMEGVRADPRLAIWLPAGPVAPEA